MALGAIQAGSIYINGIRTYRASSELSSWEVNADSEERCERGKVQGAVKHPIFFEICLSLLRQKKKKKEKKHCHAKVKRTLLLHNEFF